MPDFTEQFLIDIADKKSLPSFNDPWDTSHASSSFEDWKEVTLAAFRKVASTASGLALLQAFQSTLKRTIVEPLNGSECNAHGSAVHEFVGPREYWAKVKFDPHTYMSGSECYRKRSGANPRYNHGALPDEVLFHELSHALRGILSPRHPDELTGGLKRYGSVEEFYAVVLTNIYISDATNGHSSGLRADHNHGFPLEKELSGSFTFYESSPQTFPLINQLVKENLDFCRKLAAIKASFNPLAAYFQNFHAIKAMSQSCLAKRREVLIQKLPLPKLPQVPMTVPKPGTIAKILADEALAILNVLR